MNSSPTVEGGYYNSKMKQETLPVLLNVYIKPVFGDPVLTYNILLINSVNGAALSSAGSGWTGSSYSWIWVESQIDLMSEANVYGTNIASSSLFDTGIDNRQYAIFGLKPEYINSNNSGLRFSYWLKNVAEITHFSFVIGDGTSGGASASNSDVGVRPRFLIG